MNAEYKRDLQNNYLILKAEEESEADDYRLRMAEQNRITGLLPFQCSRRDGMLYLHYEITSLQPLASVFEKRTMGYDDILFLLAGIRDVLEEMQRYLLDPAQLVFDPEYMYVDPEHCKVRLCYLPGSEGSFPIRMLAEYILKRLDHREQQAVSLGYGFYEKAAEENFSLQKTLREMLERETPDNGRSRDRLGGTNGEPFSAWEEAGTAGLPGGDRRVYGGSGIEDRKKGTEDGSKNRQGIQADALQEEIGGVSPEIRRSYGVTHRERKSHSQRKVDRLFQLIHPAVLLSTLFLLAALEVVFYLGLLTVTEAGGIFFLLLSVETLINKFWRSAKEKKKENHWAEEEEDEMYRMLQEEMYDMPKQEPVIEETRCLTPEAEQARLYLVCTSAGASGIAGEDIFLGASPVYVGKIRGESDVILDSPTVSRRHARLECRGGVCYVKDLNSRNGTFCNGRRLRPQEQCQFGQGDEISFAEIGYRAVLR